MNIYLRENRYAPANVIHSYHVSDSTKMTWVLDLPISVGDKLSPYESSL